MSSFALQAFSCVLAETRILARCHGPRYVPLSFLSSRRCLVEAVVIIISSSSSGSSRRSSTPLCLLGAEAPDKMSRVSKWTVTVWRTAVDEYLERVC